MRNLAFHRDDHKLWIGQLDEYKKPILARIENGTVTVLARFLNEESATQAQDVLSLFLTGQSSDKAVRNG